MAIIDDKTPNPVAEEACQPRVIVRFKQEALGRVPRDIVKAKAHSPWQKMTKAHSPLEFSPLIHSRPEAGPNARASAGKGTARDRLNSYFALDLPKGADVIAVVRELEQDPDVDTAYVDPGPVPPPVDASDDPLAASQGHLNAAPLGIDARWAWSRTDGTGVGFVDLEQGWTLNHEDLAAAGIILLSGVNKAYPGHGTAVLGQVASVDNSLGCIGIAPQATTRVVSEWRSNSVYNTADAIVDATEEMAPGDVLLLEAQTSYTGYGYLPVEVYDATFDAIRAAVDAGIIVVEAAGNGSEDLDSFMTTSGRRILNRTSVDFRDSGAIMVGAATAALPHARSSFSNYRSRIDCYGWGNSITTCGDGWNGTSTTAYTSSFGGTSGASPIVSGAALLLQSWAVNHGRSRYSPSTMRAMLSDPARNTASYNPPVDRIGVMPDLRALITAQERFSIDRDRWKQVARILFGVADDAPGYVWIPGKGPVPIDPWAPHMEKITPRVRDAMASLATFEIANLVENGQTKRTLQDAALGAVKRSIEGIKLK